jgi:hypothetical protein
MTETTPSLADAGATTPVESVPAAVAPVTDAPVPETTDAQPDGTEPAKPLHGPDGKFVSHARTEKLQSKINELTAIRRQEEREVARLKQEAASIRAQLETKPDIDPADFDAQTAFQVTRAIKAEKFGDTVSQANAAQARAQDVQHQILQAQIEELRPNIPDIDRIIAPIDQGGAAFSPLMADAIYRSDNGALVAYHLLKNPSELARIKTLDPVSALVAMGQIAASIKPSSMKRISQAPAPVQTVSGGSGASGVDLQTADYDTYKATRMKQMAGR